MADNKTLYVTKEGLKKIEDEITELKSVRRKEISERIKEAKELGDLSENAEYQEAKEEQAVVEAHILELEQKIKNCEIIAHRKNTKVVQIGSKVSMKDNKKNLMSYTIVGSSEADPLKLLISNESPLGQTCIGKNVGDKLEVATPNGKTIYTIESVE
ncbi:MAG: transcription elongation factor GreA [Candidatus Kerfeldbacteria bacterium RIFOXYA2_FULL_38_24]|uniref:Transcription elongation factor GreA n=1 Tax=Candidatus Kerfeldbacteria bacterium RIFOXYB2_FULL_38_14 TaxID=1798547 RepID=A0A1G2BA54_9BACT|nr:MAG: transcription elongation factor GreA [Candidatus Kerfeldbacteria bacterium RIFOXYA2_FULL_38_24]OGY86031.1 MAG: transcription elongation factor GreA [Candidatus Kerfeldbacteria bacterium RIFOXYB2_FULL_38_14]OGY90147.1 MAG: transcription elongation factor GreA [Candidatus Kerfeldbacteria bacterium RIFOXYC2_FULL_38_9]